MDDKVPFGEVEFHLAQPIEVKVHTHNGHLNIRDQKLPPGPYRGALLTLESKAMSDDPNDWFVRLPAYVEIPYTKLVELLKDHPADPNLRVNGRCVDVNCGVSANA